MQPGGDPVPMLRLWKTNHATVFVTGGCLKHHEPGRCKVGPFTVLAQAALSEPVGPPSRKFRQEPVTLVLVK